MKFWGRVVPFGLMSAVRRGLIAGLAGVLLGMALSATHAAEQWQAPLPVAAQSVTVTLYSCGAPYPCEKITNSSDRDIQVTITNSYQNQVVIVPPHQEIVIELDSSDNR